MTATIRLGHVGLAVRDLDDAIAFFTGFLGFTLTARLAPLDTSAIPGITGIAGAVVDELAYVSCGEWVFELLHYVAPDPVISSARPCDIGSFHWLVDVGDFDAAVHRAATYGFVQAHPPYAIATGPNSGKRGIYLSNANGFTLEVIG